MRVLRLERGDLGIFMGPDAPIDEAIRLAVKRRGETWLELEDTEGAVSPYRHPTPSRDVPAWAEIWWTDSEKARAFFCGFASQQQLLAWFDSEELRVAMNDVGIHLRVYEVAEEHVFMGDHQVMFRKSEAWLVSSGPVPTLAH